MQDQQPAPDFGEPWQADKTWPQIICDKGGVHAMVDVFDKTPGLRERIIATVNACAGMVDPAAEIQALRDTLKSATHYKSAAQLCVEHPNLAEYIVQLERELMTAKLLIAANKTVWLPIETAPRDGTELLLYWFDPGGKTYFAAVIPGAQPDPPSHNVKIGFWIKRERTNREELGDGLVRETIEVYDEEWVDKSKYLFLNLPLKPTHWMPLPTPPQV